MGWFESFKHRTFNLTDTLYFLSFFKEYYNQHDSLEDAFVEKLNDGHENVEQALIGFYDCFFAMPEIPERTRKHIATPQRNSACKRINMFLRWMVRKDEAGVDFGLWNKIKTSQLICPLDVHVGRIAHQLNLIEQNKSDWKTALELTGNLKKFDPIDPVKYDYALFGMGVMEEN
ncbi:MAG: TIGR02757 family protein [Bacteroidetes bacterium]|nr:TIGR02757 family protein [Bacteroidota bacterium]